jgi:Kef-type K+ transport system membrane component KefB
MDWQSALALSGALAMSSTAIVVKLMPSGWSWSPSTASA